MSYMEKDSELNSPGKKLDQSNSKGFSQNDVQEKKPIIKNKAEAKIAFQQDVNLAKKYLLDNNIQKSAKTALRCIKQNPEFLGGENSILTLPAQFILVEAKIAEGDLKLAEEYLLGSYWTFLKYQKGGDNKNNNDQNLSKNNNDDLTEREYQILNSNLKKTFSKMFFAQNELQRALDDIKETIFMESQIYGPESINSSESYYLLGNIFQMNKDQISAESNYGIYINIWYKELKRCFRKINDNQQLEHINSIQIKQAFNILQEIQQYFDSKMDKLSSIQQYFYNKCSYSLAILYRLNDNQEPFLSYLNKVLEGYKEQYGEDSQKVMKINEIFSRIIGSEYQYDLGQDQEQDQDYRQDQDNM